MDIESWSLIVTALVGIPAIIAGAFAAWYGFKSFRASQAQLELARDQASQVPRIELMEMSGHRLRDDPDLHEEVLNAAQEMKDLQRKRVAEEKTEREREERERKEREERERRQREAQEREVGFNAETAGQMEKLSMSDLLKSLTSPTWKRTAINLANTPTLSALNLTPPKYVYEGPLPNYYLDVGIRNVGRAAAYDVTGWLWFDKEILAPVDHFASADVDAAGERHGKVKVKLSVGNEGGRLFPSHNDPYTFRVPLMVHKAADTTIEFEFTSPQGEPAHGTFNLRLFSSGGQE